MDRPITLFPTGFHGFAKILPQDFNREDKVPDPTMGKLLKKNGGAVVGMAGRLAAPTTATDSA